MRYRDNSRCQSPSTPKHHPPQGVRPQFPTPGLDELEDPPSPGNYGHDRIQNDLLEEICSDIGIRDAIDLDVFDFDVPYSLPPAPSDDLLGSLDQTIPFGAMQAEPPEPPSPGTCLRAPQPRPPKVPPDFSSSSIASPTISSSCNGSGQVSSPCYPSLICLPLTYSMPSSATGSIFTAQFNVQRSFSGLASSCPQHDKLRSLSGGEIRARRGETNFR